MFKAEELRQWLRFVQRDGSILRDYPSLLFQLAANEPDVSLPATAAARRWQFAKEVRPWLQYLNKPQQTDNCLLTLTGHSFTPLAEDLKWRSRAAIRCCRFASDGQSILSASEDGTLRLWNSVTGAEMSLLNGHQHSVTSCVFSPDGQKIYSTSADGLILLWDAKTCEPTFIIGSTPYWINACGLSTDGCILATGGRSLIIWDVETGTPTVLDGTSVDAKIFSCAFSPNGSRLATATQFNRVEVWDVASRERLLSLEGHTKWVKSCAFSSDGKTLISASDDTTLILWDAETGEKLKTLSGHSAGVQCCSFSPDGRHIVSASADHTLKVWDSETGFELATLSGHSDVLTFCAYAPDGRRVVSASADNTLKVWDVEQLDGVTLEGRDSAREVSCSYSPDFSRMVSASVDGKLRIWDARAFKTVSKVGAEFAVANVPVYSPCGERIASTYEDEHYSVRIWDPHSFECLDTFRHDDRVFDCCWSPDGRVLLIASSDRGLDGRVFVWDPRTGSRESLRQASTTTSARYSPDGRRIVSCQFDGTLKILHSQTLNELQSIKAHSGVAWCATFSPDGLLVASGASDKTVKLWDARTGDELMVLTGHYDTVRFCEFSPDGKWLVSIANDQSLGVWDLATSKTFAIYPDAVAADWGPGGESIACGSYSGGLHLLRLMGVVPGPPQITLTHLYNWISNTYDSVATARCAQCGERFEADSHILGAVGQINAKAGIAPDQSPCSELPLDAWEDPRLQSSCPHCGIELRFNPFIARRKKSANQTHGIHSRRETNDD